MKKFYPLPSPLYHSSGFALIEALTALSVFAVTMTSIIGVYLSVQRLNQVSLSLQALQQNVKFVSEDLTKTVRNGVIDYARYVCPTPGRVCQPWTVDLFLRDQDDKPVRIFQSGDNLMFEKDSQTTPFTGREVRVLDFRVFIWPQENPFNGGALKQQPTVTVFLDLESSLNARDRIKLPFQITVATREYPR